MTILLFLLWHSGTPVIRRSRSAVFALRGVVDADAPPSDLYCMNYGNFMEICEGELKWLKLNELNG